MNQPVRTMALSGGRANERTWRGAKWGDADVAHVAGLLRTVWHCKREVLKCGRASLHTYQCSNSRIGGAAVNARIRALAKHSILEFEHWRNTQSSISRIGETLNPRIRGLAKHSPVPPAVPFITQCNVTYMYRFSCNTNQQSQDLHSHVQHTFPRKCATSRAM